MRNLALEIDNGSGYQWAWLDDDASVTVENVNPVFDTEAGGTFTHSISLDVARNSHIFGAAADFRGPKIFNLLRKKKARLWVMGFPITGIIHLDTELSVENGRVEIEIVSNSKELSELLDGVNCRDVDISGDEILLGYAWDDYMNLDYTVIESYYEYEFRDDFINMGDSYNLINWKEYKESHQVALPKILFTHWRGGTQSSLELEEQDFTNIQSPYTPGKAYNKYDRSSYPYCNVRSCYSKYEEKEGNWTKKRGYMHGEPDRINSAPCFFVAYWFRKLWENMGIAVNRKNNKDGLEEITDYNRIAFFHFDPHYNNRDIMFCTYDSFSKEDQTKNKLTVDIKVSGSGCGKFYTEYVSPHVPSPYKSFNMKDAVGGIQMYNAIATSDNFPDTEAKNVLKAMEGAFGARFIYDSGFGTLSVILARDILKQNESITLPCVVIKADKTELGTQGFRLKYEGSQDATYNGITKIDDVTGAHEQYDADTNYNYTDWSNVIFISEHALDSRIQNEDRPVKIPSYIALVNHITNSDKTCYVSCTTGNAYRIKVDSDAEDESTLYPSLFQVGMFQDFKEGDCSHEAVDDGLVEEVTIPFTPAISNDIYIATEKDIYINNLDTPLKQIYAQLIDGEIHNVDIEGTGETFARQNCEYKNVIFKTYMDYAKDDNGNTKGMRTAISGSVNMTLQGLEVYDIAEDGPYYTYTNNSLVLGVMRGSGPYASFEYFNQNYDNEQGEMWMDIAGDDAEFTFDNIDEYGKSYDYNGVGSSITKDQMTITKGEAEAYIHQYFSNSNANLVSSNRKVSGEAMRLKGWTECTGDYATVFSITKTHNDYDYLLTPIRDDGTILTPSELDDYFKKMYMTAAATVDDIVVTADKNNQKLVIGRYDNVNNHLLSNTYATFLHELHDVYYGNGTIVHVPYINILGHDFEDDYNFPISLRLRAEKENPGYDPTCSKKGYSYSVDANGNSLVTLKNGTVVPNTRFFPINGSNSAGRGLGDRFYKEYAYWVLNRKILNMEVDATAAVLTGIDMTKKYRIGGVEGFIKDYSYTIDMKEGISNAKINLYYI